MPSALSGSYVDFVAKAGQIASDAEAGGQCAGEGGAGAVFAVGEDDARCGGTGCVCGLADGGFSPPDQFAAACVGAEAAEGVDLGPDLNHLAVDANLGLAFDKSSSEAVERLEADDDDVCTRVGEMIEEVVDDATTRGHARAGDDDARAGVVVDHAAFIAAAEEAQAWEAQRVLADVAEGAGLFVEEGGVHLVEACGLDGQRAVDEDGQVLGDSSVVPPAGQVIDEGLGAADGEAGDEDFATGGAGLVQDGDEFVEGFFEGFVVAVAVGAFEHDDIGPATLALGADDRGDRVADDGSAGVADIAAEDDGLLGGVIAASEDDACRADDVSAVDEACGDAGGDIDLAVEGNRAHGTDGFGDVGLGIKRLAEPAWRAVAVGAFAVAAHGVLLLDLGGVAQEQIGQGDGQACGIERAAHAVLGEQRQAACVIHVGVGDDDGVKAAMIEAGRACVADHVRRTALEDAAVDQHASAARGDEVA